MKAVLLYEPSPDHLARLQRAAPEIELVVAGGSVAAASGADVLLGDHELPAALEAAPGVRWVQSTAAGVDGLLRMSLPDATVVTCARGVYDDEVADHAVALVLSLARGLHRPPAERRATLPLATLSGCRALILGWGGIGRAVARRLLAFGMEIEAVRRSHLGPPLDDELGHRVHGPLSWRGALPRADVLVMALPLTPETRGVVGQAEIAALPQHAVVVNVGRGDTLDDTAVIAAVNEGRIAGAGLDVLAGGAELCDPAAHPAFSTPGIIVTPHSANSGSAAPPRYEALFEENLRRFADGRPLLGLVDRAAGY